MSLLDDGVKIKYDKLQLKILAVAGIVSILIFALGMALTWLEIPGTDVLLIACLYEGVGVGIVSPFMYIAGKGYFKRLAYYGYEIPDRKKNYGNRLENIPREETNAEVSYFAKYSSLGMKACFALWILFMTIDACVLFKWEFIGEDAYAVFVVCGIFYLSWIIIGFCLKAQSNRQKYRDDVELDTNRKERWSPERIVESMIILAVISFMVNSTMNNMMDYVFHARIESDYDRVDGIKSVVERIIADDANMQKFDSYEQLCEGIDIVSWGEPADELQKAIAERIQVDSYSELGRKFKMADGVAQVYVKVENGEATVTLLNPHKELAKYSRHRKEIKAD